MESKLVRISKFLSLVLRHKPEAIGISLDAEGWADVEELVKKAFECGMILDRPILRQVVEHGEKKRFSFNDDGTKIRANYGHSVPVVLKNESAEPPELLYHGTAMQFLHSVRVEGLKPGTRQYVHLVDDEKKAIEVGQRHGEPVLITIQAHMMYEKGYEFFRMENGMWLTKSVPIEYLEIEDLKGRK